MTVANYQLTIDQGTNFTLTLTWQNPNGTPVDLTGYTAKVHVVDNLNNRTSLLEFNSVSGGSPGTTLTLGGTAGTVTMGLTAAASAALTFTDGQYAVLVDSPGGVITRLLQGTVHVNSGLSW